MLLDEKTGAQANDEIIEICAAQKINAIITFKKLIVSSDLTHDPAALQHYNDKILTPL